MLIDSRSPGTKKSVKKIIRVDSSDKENENGYKRTVEPGDRFKANVKRQKKEEGSKDKANENKHVVFKLTTLDKKLVSEDEESDHSSSVKDSETVCKNWSLVKAKTVNSDDREDVETDMKLALATVEDIAGQVQQRTTTEVQMLANGTLFLLF